jgi:uncharacterized protein
MFEMSRKPSAIMARGRSGLLASLLLLAAIPASVAQNAPDAAMPAFPPLTGPVVDEAHLLPADVFQRLSQRLAGYAQANGTQVVVVTLPTLNGYPIDEYGYQLGRHWGIGQKGKNNGVLLIVDSGEHQMRIEVGYGLEGTLTDAQSFLIIHNVITPRFRKGDYAGGITAGADAILSVLGGHPLAAQQQVRERGGTGFLMFLILLFVLSPLLRALLGRGQGYGGYGGGWLGWLALGMLSSGRGGGYGGGGFGGGGFGGGFSGGGGSFGGGGASGGW